MASGWSPPKKSWRPPVTKSGAGSPSPVWTARAAERSPAGGDLLRDQLLDDLKAWNDSCDWTLAQPSEEIVDDDELEERDRELAVRVQDELGIDGWEVLYHQSGRVHRVHPPGSWPAETREQELLGYPPRGRRRQQRKRSGS